MSEPTRPLGIAEHWTNVPIDPDITRNMLEKFITLSAHNSRIALGTLAAGQAHFEAHPDVDDVTLIYPHPMLPPPESNEPFRSCLTIPGHSFKYDNSIDELAERGDLIVLTGQLPLPGALIALPELRSAIARLTPYVPYGVSSGVGYIGLSRVTIDSIISLGFANPFTGHRIEESFNLEPAKERHGFPPSDPEPQHVQ